MAIITLLSDMGTRDHYTASVKGKILSVMPEAHIVDITHYIRPFDIAQAAFVLRNCWKDFPKGTVHIISVDPELNDDTAHLIVQVDGHYFVGADNGFFSLLIDRIPDEIFELNISQDTDDLTFPMRDLFVTAATHLARGGTAEVIGKRKEELKSAASLQPVVEPGLIKGKVIYIDNYGNAITNINRRLFKEVRKKRPFSIQWKRNFELTKLQQRYGAVTDGHELALFGSTGALEIAVNKGAPGNGGGAAQLFGLKVGDTIRVEFYDD